ncbi:S-layer family protein [Nostoc sp. FACHB-110]|uniref:beta strand repeat-containing protein n=1 Tax=Nostoc sp. FACHB-110 TaxID=2692834 RepID=UPI0016870638|nr:Calx-beta domain-containing protein [Nostoc sp. FACHB-110]MBD2441121.1 M10 family metallopeptidase C-terminal domain-containing protein [Nostoc sp. FACHB-110]
MDILGTNNNDNLIGTSGGDIIQGLAGNDTLSGLGGNDQLSGGSGSDTLTGGAGNDVFVFETFNTSTSAQDVDVVTDFVQGQDKIDLRTVGISDNNTLQLLLNNDSAGNATIAARFNNFSSGNYQLKISGLSKTQLLTTDFIFSTAVVNDNITGTDYNDDLFGGLGDDTLQGNDGNDRLFGEQGNDRLLGGFGSDTLYGGAGNDVFVFETFNSFTSAQSVDVVTDFVQGQDKIDLRTVGISDNNTLQLLLNDDSVGNATIAARFNNFSSGNYQLKINGLSKTQLLTTDFIFSTAVVNDNITGTDYNDDLFGGLGDDTLQGNDGNDRLFGEQGNDRLLGGFGSDTLYGGAGNDIAVYSGNRSQYQITSSNGVFTITDTVANRDGVDILNDIEQAQFLDQTIPIGTALPSITLAVSPSSVTEDGTPNLIYTFTRTGSTTNALTINFGVAGTATLNTDYTQSGAASFTTTTGTITFAAGASTAILTINPTADTTDESNETVALTLASGTGYTIGTTTPVTGTITDDDPSGITINLSAGQTIVEGLTSPQNATYTVSLSQASSQTITVRYATANGTATAGVDYTNTTGTLTFNPGETSKVINIAILNDSTNEANETFTLSLTSPTNASLGTNTVTTTITDTLSTSSTTTLPTNVENLTLTGTAAINGTGNAGNNVLTGNSANNTLSGANGNDTYAYVANTALGTDTIVETATGGVDTINFSGTTVAVQANLGVTTSQTVNSNLKLILSANNVIENATGGTGNDRLTGNGLNNLLAGGSGNDQLQGLGGNDTLWGGLGDDILTGGTGNDQYLFQASGAFSSSLGVDYISLFEVGQDKIVLSKATFNAITNAAGQALTDFAVVSDNEFVNASSARIVFSQSSGSLFYNQDGSLLGASTVFEFARLGNPDIALSSSDFSLIA